MKTMSCNCNSPGSNNANCAPRNLQYLICSKYTPSPITEYYSQKFENLEGNYPINRTKCVDYGTNPRYYNAVYTPCTCEKKCYQNK